MADGPKPPLVPFAADVGRAPVIFFDGAPTFGGFNNIIAITLSVALQAPTNDGKVNAEQHIVAHLRTNVEGIKALQSAIERVLLAVQPVQRQVN